MVVFTVHIEGMPPRGFDEPKISIGRSTRSALVLPSPEVSRNHAVIEERGGSFVLEDCGSSHGTYVDGVRISKTAITRASQIQIALGNLRQQHTKLGHHLHPLLIDTQHAKSSQLVDRPRRPHLAASRRTSARRRAQGLAEGQPPQAARRPNAGASLRPSSTLIR